MVKTLMTRSRRNKTRKNPTRKRNRAKMKVKKMRTTMMEMYLSRKRGKNSDQTLPKRIRTKKKMTKKK